METGLAVLGLSLDIVGILLLWFFGVPLREVKGPDYLVFGPPTPEWFKRLKKLLSVLGMAMVLIGFVLQICAQLS